MGFFSRNKKDDKAKPSSSGAAALVNAALAAEADAELTFSDKALATARQWFAQARKVAEERNYDYAIECYLSGLKFWPDAVEEGHQPLRAASYARLERGGKKAGTLEVMKHSMTGKNSLEAMLNAEWLWARDPQNVSYMEGFVKNAAKGRFEKTVLFIAPIYYDAIKSEGKPKLDRFVVLRKIYDELGERCERRQDIKKALTFYQGALTVLQVVQQLSPPSKNVGHDLTDLATKITILKGKYESAEDFRDSVSDAGAQRDIQDRDRMVIDEQRLDELTEDARREWCDNPTIQAKLLNLVDLLCREEQEDSENEAIKLLEQESRTSKNYAFKMRADDIRMKHLRRRVRAAGNDPERVKSAKAELLKFELTTFQERLKQYPTDNRIKFEFAKRLVQARKFDEAIPILQDARNDPKNRFACMNLVGRCFYEKHYFPQAMDIYRKAIAEYELIGDDLCKELHYWLGRSAEADGNAEEAEKAFGQLIQWDYNFRDVRQRLDAFMKKD